MGDSGAADLNPPEWIAKVHPQVVLLSVGAGDREGWRWSPETLAALQVYSLLRTGRNNWIELTMDGEQF